MKYKEEEIIKLLREDSGAAERDQAAAMLLEQYAGLLWSVCQRRLQDPEDIKECVNSTFAQVCLHPERYDAQKGSLKNYLCRIADRKAIDCYHERERRQRAEESFVQEMQSGAGVTRDITTGTRAANGAFMATAAADGYASGEERAAEKLEEALEQLDPMDSQILRMKYYDGLTYQEIAAQLGLTEATVKMRSLRSRRKLLKILIVVLILALLAACAVAVLRRYQFSGNGGFSWSDEKQIYELVEGDYSWETEQIRGRITDASYVVTDGKYMLTISITAQWLGEDVNANMLLRKALADEILRWDAGNDESDRLLGGFNVWFYDKNIYGLEYHTLEYYVQFEGNVDLTGEDQILCTLYRDEERFMDLPLQMAEYMEYDASESKISLWNGTEWMLGPAIAANPFTILSIYGSQNSDWILNSTLVHSRYGMMGTQIGSVTLVALDGTEYSVMRVTYQQEQVAKQEENTQFDLYFLGVPAGEYQLRIPLLYYTRSWNSQEFTLSLPVEEEVLVPCDVSAQFPDGSGYHITGVTKRLYENIEYQQYDGSDELHEVITYYWEYVLEVDKRSAELPVFQGAEIECLGNTEIRYGFSEEGKPVIRILKDSEPEQISLRLIHPEYVVEQDFVMDVTVREAP